MRASTRRQAERLCAQAEGCPYSLQAPTETQAFTEITEKIRLKARLALVRSRDYASKRDLIMKQGPMSKVFAQTGAVFQTGRLDGGKWTHSAAFMASCPRHLRCAGTFRHLARRYGGYSHADGGSASPCACWREGLTSRIGTSIIRNWHAMPGRLNMTPLSPPLIKAEPEVSR